MHRLVRAVVVGVVGSSSTTRSSPASTAGRPGGRRSLPVGSSSSWLTRSTTTTIAAPRRGEHQQHGRAATGTPARRRGTLVDSGPVRRRRRGERDGRQARRAGFRAWHSRSAVASGVDLALGGGGRGRADVDSRGPRPRTRHRRRHAPRSPWSAPARRWYADGQEDRAAGRAPGSWMYASACATRRGDLDGRRPVSALRTPTRRVGRRRTRRSPGYPRACSDEDYCDPPSPHRAGVSTSFAAEGDCRSRAFHPASRA